MFVSARQLDSRELRADLGSISAGPLKNYSRLFSCDDRECTQALEVDGDVPSLAWVPGQPTGFAWTAFTLHRSSDAGASFEPLFGYDNRPFDILRDIDVAPDGSLYATVLEVDGFRGELYVSDDDGDSWTRVSTHQREFTDMTVLPDGVMLAANYGEDASGIRCSVDGGRTWADRCPARP